MSLTLNDILGILVIYQSLVFIFSFLFIKKYKPLFVKILVSICLTIIFHFGYMILGNHGVLNEILLGPFFGLMYGPLYYVYTKSLILENSNPKDIAIHFIPAFFALPTVLFFGDQLAGSIQIVGLIVSAHFIAYLILALLLIYKYRKQLMSTTSSFYKISLSWLEFIIYLQLTTIMIMLLESYFQTLINTNFFISVIYFLVLILIHCFYYLGIKQIRLFKGFKNEISETGEPKEYNLPESTFKAYLDKLTTYMEHDRPYLDYDISLQDLADKLSISQRNLSYVINREFKRNYYGFINHYRLELAKNLLKASDKPIKEVMYESGFSNKATFYAIFKKDTGQTPLQYRENQKK